MPRERQARWVRKRARSGTRFQKMPDGGFQKKSVQARVHTYHTGDGTGRRRCCSSAASYPKDVHHYMRTFSKTNTHSLQRSEKIPELRQGHRSIPVWNVPGTPRRNVLVWNVPGTPRRNVPGTHLSKSSETLPESFETVFGFEAGTLRSLLCMIGRGRHSSPTR